MASISQPGALDWPSRTTATVSTVPKVTKVTKGVAPHELRSHTEQVLSKEPSRNDRSAPDGKVLRSAGLPFYTGSTSRAKSSLFQRWTPKSSAL